MNVISKQLNASMPINHYDDNILKLMVYGTAYMQYATQLQKDYKIISVIERFVSNPKNETRTLFVTIELIEKEKEQ